MTSLPAAMMWSTTMVRLHIDMYPWQAAASFSLRRRWHWQGIILWLCLCDDASFGTLWRNIYECSHPIWHA